MNLQLLNAFNACSSACPNRTRLPTAIWNTPLKLAPLGARLLLRCVPIPLNNILLYRIPKIYSSPQTYIKRNPIEGGWVHRKLISPCCDRLLQLASEAGQPYRQRSVRFRRCRVIPNHSLLLLHLEICIVGSSRQDHSLLSQCHWPFKQIINTPRILIYDHYLLLLVAPSRTKWHATAAHSASSSKVDPRHVVLDNTDLSFSKRRPSTRIRIILSLYLNALMYSVVAAWHVEPSTLPCLLEYQAI